MVLGISGFNLRSKQSYWVLTVLLNHFHLLGGKCGEAYIAHLKHKVKLHKNEKFYKTFFFPPAWLRLCLFRGERGQKEEEIRQHLLCRKKNHNLQRGSETLD